MVESYLNEVHFSPHHHPQFPYDPFSIMLPSRAVSPKFCSDFVYYLPFSLVREACSVQAFCVCSSSPQCLLLTVFRIHSYNSLCSSVIPSACYVTATRRSCVCMLRNVCPSVCRHGQPAGHHTRQGCER